MTIITGRDKQQIQVLLRWKKFYVDLVNHPDTYKKGKYGGQYIKILDTTSKK